MRRKKRKKITALILAAAMMSSALLTGCGREEAADTQDSAVESGREENKTEESTGASGEESSAGSEEKIKLTMVTYLGNPSRDALIQELVADLDHIELEIISPPSEQALQKISAMLQTGEGIDIVEVDSVPVNHISNGFIEPLDSYLENWEDWGSVSEYLKDQLATYDGHIYSVPYGVYERALFYRKDWFEEKNLSVPGTWEELYRTAVELTDPSQNRYGYSFRGGAGTGGFAEMTILSFIQPEKIDSGLSFLTKDGRSMFHQPEAVAADPDSYVGYVPGGEYRYASEEEKEQMSEYETARDVTVQEMLLGQITPEECAAEFASYFQWTQESAWVKDRMGSR